MRLPLVVAAPAGDAAAQPPVTFNRDVAPILFEHCSTCHRPGEIGPFSLLSYRGRATARGGDRPSDPERGDAALEAGARRQAEFIGARRLTPRQIATLERWVADGALEGDPRRPAADYRAIPDGWQLGRARPRRRDWPSRSVLAAWRRGRPPAISSSRFR